MKWLLKLKRPEDDFERWKELLETVEERVYREGAEYYLQFPELEDIEKPREAHEEATSFLNRLNRTLKHVSKETDQLEAAGFYQVTEDGEKRGHVFLGMAESSSVAYAPTIESTNPEKRIQRRKRFVEAAMSDERIDEILQLREQELTPTNMYNILEGIVKYDLGKITTKDGKKRGSFKEGKQKVKELDWFSKNEIKALKRGLEHRKTAGIKARHYFAQDDPPRKELSLRQMREMTRVLIRKWLAHKEAQFWEGEKEEA